MERTYSVYVHTFPNGKKYVGITSLEPEKRWLDGRGYRNHTLVKNAIRKYGWDNIEHDVILTGLTRKDACQAEIETIAKLQTTDVNYGYNMNSGGDAKIPTKETLAKITGKNHWNYGNKGKWSMPQDAKDRIGKANSGERHYLFGKHLSDEHRNNVSISLRGEKNGFYGKKHKEDIFAHRRKAIFQINKDTKEIIKRWNSAWEVEDQLGYNHSGIAACCKGKYHTCRGYVWRYAD